MMLSDPWDLKHSIQQLQQEQSHSKKLITQQQKSTTNFTQNSVQETNYELQTHYESQIQDHEQEDISSNDDENEMNNTHIIQKTTQSSSNYKNQQSQIHQSEFIIDTHKKHTRNKYGNLIVFFETSSSFFSLGPNYLFFTFAYICFTLASIYLVKLVNVSIENPTFKIFNFLFCLLQNLSYLLVAFSNPGVKLPPTTNPLMSADQIKDKNRFCKKCGALQQRKTYHCRQCDICIQDYDHHCPWTSKCIGGGNLKRFYLFVGVTPFYIFYYVITFMICMANLALQQTQVKNQSQLPKL